MVTATGGGYGDPFKRPAEKVAMDVKNEYITADQAKEDYGVLVDPNTFQAVSYTHLDVYKRQASTTSLNFRSVV